MSLLLCCVKYILHIYKHSSMLTDFLNLLQMKCWISDSKWSYFFASLNILDKLSLLMFDFVFKNKWYLLLYLLANTLLRHFPYMCYTHSS